MGKILTIQCHVSTAVKLLGVGVAWAYLIILCHVIIEDKVPISVVSIAYLIILCHVIISVVSIAYPADKCTDGNQTKVAAVV